MTIKSKLQKNNNIVQNKLQENNNDNVEHFHQIAKMIDILDGSLFRQIQNCTDRLSNNESTLYDMTQILKDIKTNQEKLFEQINKLNKN